MKKLFAALFITFGPCVLLADVTDAEVRIIARFLDADYASAQNNVRRLPVAAAFFVAETEERDMVNEEDARNAKEYYSANLPIGEYRKLWIISDTPNFGTLARQAFLGPNGIVSWSDDLQGLARLRLRAELGQRGAHRLMELPEQLVRDIFGRARRGSLTLNHDASALEKAKHLESMDVLFRVALMRSGPP